MDHAVAHAEWINDDSHYVKNNHGIMMDLALAQFSIMLRPIDHSRSNNFLDTCSRRLEMMFNLTFDRNGCCTENSPTYHFVNYALFLAVLNFMYEYELVSDSNQWQDRLEKARNVGNLFLRSDGSIPLVGDSETKPGTFFPQPDHISHKYGIGYYPSAGFFVASLSNSHLTFKAGGVSYSHRHVDDLSLTLQHGGKDFIVDCGLYNYDIQDKMRRWFISSRAHSGPYVESMGDVRFANFKSPFEMSRFISADGDALQFAVTAVHNLSKEVEIKRFLSYRDNSLEIEDSFDCEIEQFWRIQFHLHPDVKFMKIEDECGFILKNGDASLKLYVDPRYQTQSEITNYSPEFMNLVSTQSLVIKGKGKTLRVKTVFKL